MRSAPRRARGCSGGPRPRGGGVAAAGAPGHPRARAARRAPRHDPAVPDVLGDLRRRAQGAARRNRSCTGDSVTTATTPLRAQREPERLGQTVVVIGGSAGIGLATARRGRAEGAEVVLTGRNPERLERAARDGGARSTAAFDATDPARLGRFFEDLPTPVDHVMVTAGGPYYAPLAEMDFAEARRSVDAHVWLGTHAARGAVDKVRPGGTLLFVSGTGARRPAVGL